MKTPTRHICIVTLLTLLVIGSSLVTAAPLGTAFTYQGRLASGTNPANGSYDFKFTLYDVAEDGAPVSLALTNSPVTVSNGLFTVALDFGAGVCTGAVRWLEIGVRSNGAPSFTTLNPRQSLTPAPYSLYAPSAGNAALLNGQSPAAYAPAAGSPAYVAKAGDTMTGTLNLPANGLAAGGNQLVLAAGNVGIGTTSPQAALDVYGEGRMGSLDVQSAWGHLAFNAHWDGGISEWRRLGDGPASALQHQGAEGGFYWLVAGGGAAGEVVNWNYAMRLATNGNVGIGTASPAEALEVRREVLIKGNNDGGTEYNDWPFASLSIRRSDDFSVNGVTMLSLGYRNDPLYATDDSVANIRLWDPSQSPNAATSTNTTQLRIASPGPLVLQPNGGNVGIGTPDPATKFEVQGGPIKATGGLIIETRTNDPPSPVTGQVWLRTDR